MELNLKFWFMASLAVMAASVFERKRRGEIKSNPREGGWSKKRIKTYNLLTGSNLKAGVSHDPKTLEDFKRKGSWAIRHYKRKNAPDGLNQAPLKNEKGELTAFSTQAKVWGEVPPKTRAEQKRLVKLGERLLKVHREFKEKGLRDDEVLPLSVRSKFKKTLKK